ncbi:putative polyketide synthase protein [Botrytis fragariae]|uniref:Putative polyketide synthase protein n=1 Tax=Botrytis fragariae TaxID=1964551 RepID=A0A8H6EEJ7_9HELO|nr:putative polyketide synthase protein [Botrytis fragariae]KAF5869444.1 putative polyketide synthase protein [Botrytis fragariae]
MGSLPLDFNLSPEACEPIAIIGMSCRWPGDSESPSELWDFLKAKRTAYSAFPEDRIKTKSFYHANGNRPGSFYTEGGAFLKSDVRNFDHTFFGIHPREVMSMDPAQRKFMEVVYEAFESGGVPMHKLAGSKTGCFVGNFNYDHQLMQYRDPEYPQPYSVTGGGITVLSNRVNYIFDLKGPSMTLDTACSSSMYALHLACSSIQTGECTAAVVGGSNLILTPECQLFSSVLGAVSPTSICHTFDAAADGYARADGIGALYIKSLAQAVKDGDPIRAVIRGTAINANGRTGGITHPSPDGQEAVIRRAYERAGGLDPALTGYFECHGTGTAVGDPLEISAIGRVFAKSKSRDSPLLIGSIKSNMGHSEPSSGIAGVMKAVIAIEHGVIPPTVGLKTLNPNIDLKDGRLKIVTESTPWPDLPVRRASINSFGYGGANAHAIIESVDSVLPWYRESRQIHANKVDSQAHRNGVQNGDVKLTHMHRNKFLLPFSAHDERTLVANISALKNNISDWNLNDIAYTLSERRSLFSHRTFQIASFGTDHQIAELAHTPKKISSNPPTLGFVFTGQGAQWPEMGVTLMHEFPIYQNTIRTLDAYLDELQDGRSWTIEDALRQPKDKSQIHDAELSQPLVTATQIALVNLLSDWGIRPSAVVGHSSGEIAASYAAGLVTERNAIIAAYLRGRSVAENKEDGLMMAVGLGAAEVRAYIGQNEGKVIVACHNSPESVTLSGDKTALLSVKEALDGDKKFARLLSTGGNAYHSHHMKPLGPEYQTSIEKYEEPSYPKVIKAQPSKEPAQKPAAFFSSVYGRALDEGANIDGSYWRQNMESPVLFAEAVAALVTSVPVDILVEIGPHSALQGPLRQISKNHSGRFPEYLTAIVRNNDNASDILTLAGTLFTKGHRVNLTRVNESKCPVDDCGQVCKIITDLPHYQWQYSDVLLLENRYTREWRQRQHPRHDILGSRIPGGVKDAPTWRNILRNKDLPWLTDHRVGQEIVFPSTGYLAMAIEAATQAVEVNGGFEEEISSYEIQDVSLQKALMIPEEDGGIEILFTLRKASLNTNSDYESRFEFLLTSVDSVNGEDNFVEHCRGTVHVNFKPDVPTASSLLQEIDSSRRGLKDIPSLPWYEKFASVGLIYGPTFQGLSSIKGADQKKLAEAKIPLKPTAKLIAGESRYVIHPAAFDAAMQLSIVASHSSTATKFKKAVMPVSIGSIKIWPKVAKSTKASAHCVARGALKGVRGLVADLILLGDTQSKILEAKDVLLIASDQSSLIPSKKDSPYLRLTWKPLFEELDDDLVSRLFPPITLDDSAVLPSLNLLALYQLIQFRETHQEIFAKGSEVPHLQRMLEWTVEQLDRMRNDPLSPATQISNLTNEQRAEKIEKFAADLKPKSSECRLMCHLYNNLPDIYAGRKTGIQVALQDNLLIDNYESGQVYKEGNKRLASMAALYAHQQPDLKILEVGAGTGSATREILPALKGNTVWRQYAEYRFTDTTTSFLAGAEDTFKDFAGMTFGAFDMERPANEQGYQPEWDLIVASNVIHATSNIKRTLENIRSALKPGGKIILLELTRSNLSAGLVLGTFSDFWKGDLDTEFPRRNGPFLSKTMWRAVLPEAGFKGLDFHLDDYAGDHISATVICATAAQPSLAPNPDLPSSQPGITLVYRSTPSAYTVALKARIEQKGMPAELLELSESKRLQYKRLLFVVELERPLFLEINPSEWTGLQNYFKQATSVLWVTSGNLLEGKNPEFAMISGLARGLKVEDASLKLVMLDVDRALDPTESKDLDLLLSHEDRISNKTGLHGDVEFRQKNGIVYISRVVPDEVLNEESKAKGSQQTSTQEVQLADVRSTPLKLAIDKPGVLSTIHFQEDPDFTESLADDCVEIEVAYAGINNKDIAVVTGRHHSNTFSDECAGVITKIGAAVKDLKLGDRVYCQSFAKFGNFVRDKACFCKKLQPEDTFESASTLPIAFCTAIYGLIDLGRLRSGESVLIQSATGAVGLAAIQIARLCGAEIYATVGTKEKKEQLLKMGYGITEDHIFWSRDADSAQSLWDYTKGKGIDVILCSARGEMMHDYWRCIAPMGRFVEIGRTEILEKGKLNLDVFQRTATFASFDLEVMSNLRPKVIGDLMASLDHFKRVGLIRPLPYTAYHVSEIDKALMTFGKGAHIGKIVVGYEQKSSIGLKVRFSPFKSKFDPNAAYLLVGCLGGLGRSFSRWAVNRGARNLIYLSRSGNSNKNTKAFLSQLRLQGVNTQIVQGDVASLADVKSAVSSTDLPIKGVIQGALTLHDGLFSSMTLDQFESTVRPRVIGTLNLHEALKDSPLDFFQMWSSWTVMFGTATQSNYLSSNAFMDAFARYRQSLGLPATSLSLSQVLGIGIVSYMPEYQQAMIRNGFYGNDEDEFLQYCDAGIGPASQTTAYEFDPLAQGHLLVGIEPAGLQEINKKYPIDDMPWSLDPRFRNLVQATHMLSGVTTLGKETGDQSEGLSIVERIRHKISRLLYVDLDEVDTETPINKYGIDSMIAAEIRNWLFTKFGKDVSLLTMLGATTTVTTLAEVVSKP